MPLKAQSAKLAGDFSSSWLCLGRLVPAARHCRHRLPLYTGRDSPMVAAPRMGRRAEGATPTLPPRPLAGSVAGGRVPSTAPLARQAPPEGAVTPGGGLCTPGLRLPF